MKVGNFVKDSRVNRVSKRSKLSKRKVSTHLRTFTRIISFAGPVTSVFVTGLIPVNVCTQGLSDLSPATNNNS